MLIIQCIWYCETESKGEINSLIWLCVINIFVRILKLKTVIQMQHVTRGLKSEIMPNKMKQGCGQNWGKMVKQIVLQLSISGFKFCLNQLL